MTNYILENFEDLKAGLSFMKRKASQRSEGPITIVRSNLMSILDCLDSLTGLKICGMDCLLSAEWKSSSKIVARTGPGKGKGDIIAITRSGGKGSCTVGFRGYFLQIGPLQDSAVWIDESQTVRPNLDHGRPTASAAAKEEDDPLGILDEGDRAKLTEDELLEMFHDASTPFMFQLFNHQNRQENERTGDEVTEDEVTEDEVTEDEVTELKMK
uniref:Exocyst complex component 2 n=1 Tax=Biomphalaria glabrata TaxID=6526 RepID=A0A2C9JZR4_BIOGL